MCEYNYGNHKEQLPHWFTRVADPVIQIVIVIIMLATVAFFAYPALMMAWLSLSPYWPKG